MIAHGVSHVTTCAAQWKDSLHSAEGLPLLSAAVEVEGPAARKNDCSLGATTSRCSCTKRLMASHSTELNT